MDTSMSSQSQAVDEPYVSCILIDGDPILPPIMNEAKRKEMRHYRDLAIQREQSRRLLQLNIHKNPTNVTTSDSRPSTGTSSNFSPPSNMHLTSTPRAVTVAETELGGTKLVDNLYNQSSPGNHPNKENIMSEDMRNSGNLETDQEIKSMSTSTSSHEQGSEDEGSVSSLEEFPSEGGNFASTGSSTRTFIIKGKKCEQSNSSEKSEGEVDDFEDEGDQIEEPKTILRKSPTGEPTFKRKRPARYFDADDDPSSKSEQSTYPSTVSSTSLSKYLTMTQTPSASSESTVTPTIFMPNFVSGDETGNLKKDASPTFTINTEFAATALALSKSNEKPTRRRSTGSRKKKSSFFSSPVSPARKSDPSVRSTTDPNFDFILTTEIPLSARKSSQTPSKSEPLDEVNSDSSDKENRIEKKKHVRKLSYTLETPSAALLAVTAASSVDGNASSRTLDPIHSVPSSVAPSTQNTPSKGQQDDNKVDIPPATPTCGDLDCQIDKVQVTLAKFQELSLGKGKQAHLERYIEELNDADGKNKTSTESNRVVGKAEMLLTEKQLQREKQLELLKQQFDLQVQKIQQEFEREQMKLMAELAIEQEQQRQKEISSSNQPAVLADTSNLRNYYISNETPTKEETNSQILSSIRSGSVTSGNYFVGQAAPGTPINHPEQLGNVGLSKLQKQMQKMNPALFKNPADARSPLLKGLVFPDPLDRPKAPLRIPPEAYDPAMKPKFERLTALVKGYLTRRLLHSEKIQIIIQTVRDTVELLLKLYEESSATENGLVVKSQDEELHRRLVQQLTGACSSFHDVFFKLSVKERMAIIANDREKIRAKALRNVLNRQSNSFGSPSKKNISSATLKRIEQKLKEERSPNKKDNQSRRVRKAVKSSSYGHQGSNSVKPKPVKSYNLSPKRRRMSYWEDKSSKPSTADSSGNSNNNASKLTVPESARSGNSTSTSSARETTQSSGFSDTFLIPSSRQTSASQNSSVNKSRPSTGVSRFSVGKGNSSQTSSSRSTRNSISTARVPWK